jgi:hypothetical protein
VYGETAGRLYPAWQRIRDRRKRSLAWLIVAATIGLLAGMAWFGWSFTDAYQIREIAEHPPLSHPRSDEELLVALARSGRLAQAQYIAIRNDEYKIERLNALAKELLIEGNRGMARSTYELALQSRSDGQILIPPVPSEVVANSILLGVRDDLVDSIGTKLSGSVEDPLGDVALKLAKGGMFDRAVVVARKIGNNLENEHEGALIELSEMAPDRSEGIALLSRS